MRKDDITVFNGYDNITGKTRTDLHLDDIVVSNSIETGKTAYSNTVLKSDAITNAEEEQVNFDTSLISEKRNHTSTGLANKIDLLKVQTITSPDLKFSFDTKTNKIDDAAVTGYTPSPGTNDIKDVNLLTDADTYGTESPLVVTMPEKSTILADYFYEQFATDSFTNLRSIGNRNINNTLEFPNIGFAFEQRYRT